MINFYDVIAASEGIAVADEFAALWGRKISGGYVISTYTGTLPATLQTVAGFLESYKIWGNTGGVGIETENLFSSSFTANYNINPNGEVVPYPKDSSRCATITPINVSNLTTVTFSFTNTSFNDKKQFIYALFDGSTLVLRNAFKESGSSINVSRGNKLYLCIYSDNANIDSSQTITNIMLNLGSNALPYVPYGYKLPILSNDTATDIYIGDTQLAKDEYVDSETGQIYRYVDGTLTPTDPPVPLPQIPTFADETIVDYGITALPYAAGLDGIFEFGNIDGQTWKNSVSGENDITFDTAATDTGAEYVLPAGATGQYTSKSGEYRTAFTWYCIAKCPTTCRDAGQYMISNWNNQGVEISSGWGAYSSAGTNHLIRSINNNDFNSAKTVTSYALIVVSGDANGAASVFVNGEKMTDSYTINPVSASAADTIFLGKRASGQLSGTDIDYKFLAFGTVKQTDAEIAANSQYLMTKYLGVGRPEKVELKYRR